MGEYWKPVNVTRQEFVNPHTLGCGLKDGEWNYPDSPVMKKIHKIWGDNDDVRMVSDYGGERQLWGQRNRKAVVNYDCTMSPALGYVNVSRKPSRPNYHLTRRR